MEIAVSTPAATSEMRVRTINLPSIVYEPSNKMIDLITPTGKKVSTGSVARP
jgi:hypothetical protein